MFFFITFLRAFGAIIITNAHYTTIYPYPILASGGLLGDVIFFAVSGYCISQIKDNFFKWYKGRIIRVYTPVCIITTIYLIFGFYNLKKWNIVEYFIYPTYYHFVASLMVIYIPLYFIIKHKKLKNNIIKIIGISLVVQILVYVFYYNYSYYHIDTVREPMIRFLFFNSMLIGLYFKNNHQRFLNKSKVLDWIMTLIMGISYFFSKLLFSRVEEISSYQILN